MAPGIAMTVREGLRKKNRNNSLYGLGKRPLAITDLWNKMIAVVGIPSFKMKEGEKMFRKTHLGDCAEGGCDAGLRIIRFVAILTVFDLSSLGGFLFEI